MKKLILMMTLGGLLLTSCGNSVDTSGLKVISPTGAPALAFYNKATQLTTGGAAEVKPELLKSNYDFVVFDFYNGLKIQKEKQGHYKLARILTAGNLYLVGINHTEKPTEGAKVASFSENSLPDLAFKELYGDRGLTMSYTADATGIGPVLKSGKIEGVEQDYVVVPEPVLSKVLLTMEDISKYTIFSFAKDWKEAKGEDHIVPQAGLFVNMDKYNENKVVYDSFINELGSDITIGVNNPNKIKDGIDSIGNADAQVAKFGINSTDAYNAQKDRNGVGLLTSYNKSMVTSFLNDIGKGAEDYSDYIL